jgi:hemerythrin superfamily protein
VLADAPEWAAHRVIVARASTNRVRRGSPLAAAGSHAREVGFEPEGTRMSRATGPGSRNAVDVLVADHRAVDRLFDRFEALTDTTDVDGKRELVREITRELSIHASIEEQLFYPAVREHLPQGDAVAAEGLDEHQGVKDLLRAIGVTDPGDPRYDERVTMLIREVRHHVIEEETEILPGLRQRLGEDVLLELGERLQHAKATAPTIPHPNAPSEGGAVTTMGDRAMGFLDRVGDDVSDQDA